MAPVVLRRAQARDDFRRAIKILQAHGLKQSARYCAEVLVGLATSDVSAPNGEVLVAMQAMEDGARMETEESETATSACDATLAELEAEPVSDAFLLASTLFNLGEYARCAAALTGVERAGGPLPASSPPDDLPSREVFLWAYALYLAGEKRKEEKIIEAKRDPLARARATNSHVEPLREVLQARRARGCLKGLGMYALGIVLKELALSRSASGYEEIASFLEAQQQQQQLGEEDRGLPDGLGTAGTFENEVNDARDVLAESARLFPWNWSAWLDMSELTSPSFDHRPGAAAMTAAMTRRPPDLRGTVGSAELVQACHVARVAIEQQRCDDALKLLGELKVLLETSTFVVAHEALAHYARRDFEAAQERFETLRAADPFRLEQLDIYSNVLYVKEARAELSRLAHAAIRTEKYRPETCCVIGNFYSLKRQHERAVIYFQRALRLDRQCLSAWTLMGHEYIEMKNTAAAIEAYRRAVDVNSRDYRAWYGLGQTYEILNMFFYALYYYRKAARLRPYDARMWIAIAQCHEKLHRIDDAVRHYERAANNDDAEGHATLCLARLHRQRNDHERATECYQRYLDALPDDTEILEPTAEALLYLATRLKQQRQFQAAQLHLARLLDFAGPEKLEAQAMLREIRALADAAATASRR
ncbi:hypothetical protein CTAYLR_003403 [Chrysophaeum taylorii]|uniref:Cdc23 domain-containing protein n=1 Tax=Chrysophaeum taylorii TaxID=2483200 RepID=A0AAD7XKT2_9STRA|nr:hypothetical protein CTAYLR_003403 [Chrysophaeum taylorii]